MNCVMPVKTGIQNVDSRFRGNDEEGQAKPVEQELKNTTSVRAWKFIKVSRRDAPDHIIDDIAKATGLDHIISAYNLPREKSGPLSDYVGNGALMPIRIDCPDNKQAKIIDIVKESKE